MDNLKDTILRSVENLMPEVVRVRRHIHMHPELSYQEHATSAFIKNYLDNLGIEYISGIAGTGIVGIIAGALPGKGITIGLRADMDALPVTEEEGREYGSRITGVMHACGHDSHVAMLLGTATLLQKMKGEFSGTVLLVFQPGEEKAPGGARLMIESGVFEKFKPDIFLAQHVLPDLPTGTIGYRSGPYMASCDEIYITIKGRGGHAAQPSLYTDQIYIASELVLGLKDSINKMSEEKAPTVFGIGNISGKGATNVIPEIVEIAGTFRTFDEKWREEAKEIIRSVSSGVATKSGVEILVNIVEGYPVLTNDESVTSEAIELSKELFGNEKVWDMPVRMSSEDFSFFSVKYPSVLFRLGITPPGTISQRLHTSSFDIDEKAMAAGISNMIWLTLRMLNNSNPKEK
jgi:amidohydrolase